MSAGVFLNRTADHALRAMLYLGTSGRAGMLRSEDLARATGIPPYYLQKVLRRLVDSRLLISERGHNGGVALARPARSISFGDVLRAVGDDPRVGCCAGCCVRQKRSCPLHSAYLALRRWADGRSIAGQRSAARRRRPARRAK
ncbi:MAG: Rrf2 family transcriptional regulator [Polyangiaceae bacterium]|nr:Rrf2 family transcriptional regulator [Polyangiaceae bacterium]MCE7889152.1 Rrf2 family transcriptional regulator [Sorangiineae bacterium PRO1]MCL4755616.1 Rrf2 family transcriptional regulator [Myxococcales bacterium]